MPARALSALVVVMGVLIVGGLAALAVGVARRAGHATHAPEAPLAVASRPFAAAPIDLPKGAHIAAISTGTDRLVVDVALPDGSQQLVIIDLATGRRLGTVPLRPAP
jgi:hypothetical protein